MYFIFIKLNNIVQELGFPLTSETRGREVVYFFDMDDPQIGKIIFDNLPLMKDDFLFDKGEKLLIEFLFTKAEGTIPTVSKRIDTLYKKMQTLLSFAGHVSQTEEIIQTKEHRRGVSVVHSFIELVEKLKASIKDLEKTYQS